MTCEAVRPASEKSAVLFDCFAEFFFLQYGFAKDISLPLNKAFNPFASRARNFTIKMNVSSTAM